MKLLTRFLALSRGKQIGVVVCLTHFLLVFALIIHHLATSRSKPLRPMVVRTLQTAPLIKQMSALPEKPKVLPKNPDKPKPAAKKEEKPKPTLATPKPASKPTSKPAPKPAVSDEATLKEMAQALESLSTSKQTRPQLHIPSKREIKKAPVETKEEPTYGEYLVAYLQSALDLPEFGEVRAKIEIDRFGKLIDCQILEAKSGKNAEFLKNQLPDLTFPCLNDFGIVDATHVFTITFRNDENR